MYIGWWFYLQVSGTPNHYLLSLNFFSSQMVGTLQPSVEVPSLPLCSLNSPFAPFTSCLFPFALHSLPLLPFIPCRWWAPQVVGTLKTLCFPFTPFTAFYPFAPFAPYTPSPSLLPLPLLLPFASFAPFTPYTPFTRHCPFTSPFAPPSLPLLPLCPHMW